MQSLRFCLENSLVITSGLLKFAILKVLEVIEIVLFKTSDTYHLFVHPF
jgi:hypothetical protein